MALVQNAPTLEQALDDVEARFLYNLPRSELEHTERLFFQIEQAYWFYEDFKADVHSNLPHFSTLKSFATKLFSHSALLSQVSDKFQELFSDFKSYKSKIPVYGVIMLNPKMTKAVLVCDYGSKSWTFPRGKINEKETEFACAVREVFEETGFDASPHCREEDHLVAFNDGKQIKMYVACNVPESTVFEIHTRKEISEVQFHPLDALPKTYAVMPFLEKLKRWINKRRQRNASVQKTPVLAAVKSPSRNNNKENKEKDTTTNASTLSRKHKNNQSASEKSPVLHSSSPNLTALNHVTQPSPSTAKRMKNLFDMRNGDTFEEEQSKGWSVNSMFAANAKITGTYWNCLVFVVVVDAVGAPHRNISDPSFFGVTFLCLYSSVNTHLSHFSHLFFNCSLSHRQELLLRRQSSPVRRLAPALHQLHRQYQCGQQPQCIRHQQQHR